MLGLFHNLLEMGFSMGFLILWKFMVWWKLPISSHYGGLSEWVHSWRRCSSCLSDGYGSPPSTTRIFWLYWMLSRVRFLKISRHMIFYCWIIFQILLQSPQLLIYLSLVAYLHQILSITFTLLLAFSLFLFPNHHPLSVQISFFALLVSPYLLSLHPTF